MVGKGDARPSTVRAAGATDRHSIFQRAVCGLSPDPRRAGLDVSVEQEPDDVASPPAFEHHGSHSPHLRAERLRIECLNRKRDTVLAEAGRPNRIHHSRKSTASIRLAERRIRSLERRRGQGNRLVQSPGGVPHVKHLGPRRELEHPRASPRHPGGIARRSTATASASSLQWLTRLGVGDRPAPCSNRVVGPVEVGDLQYAVRADHVDADQADAGAVVVANLTQNGDDLHGSSVTRRAVSRPRGRPAQLASHQQVEDFSQPIRGRSDCWAL